MLRVSGTGGTVRAGYQTAADLGAWELELLPVLPRAYRLSAVVRTISDYWLAQTPLSLVLPVGAQEWRWPSVTLAAGADPARITIRLATAPRVTLASHSVQEAVWVRSGR
jgi:Ser/Thr protein kinase RdoA (MazF antagonist)